jgi:hypothetical protein
MDSISSVIAGQYTQERIARAQAERLANEARQVRSGKRGRRRAFRLFRGSAVANGVGARR